MPQALLDRNRTIWAFCLQIIGFFVPSCEVARALTGYTESKDMVKLFRARGAKGIIGIKLGAKRCHLTSKGESVAAPACRVERVVDKTGPGDALSSGVITGFDHGMELTGGMRSVPTWPVCGEFRQLGRQRGREVKSKRRRELPTRSMIHPWLFGFGAGFCC